MWRGRNVRYFENLRFEFYVSIIFEKVTNIYWFEAYTKFWSNGGRVPKMFRTMWFCLEFGAVQAEIKTREFLRNLTIWKSLVFEKKIRLHYENVNPKSLNVPKFFFLNFEQLTVAKFL